MSDRILKVIPEGEQEVLPEFRRETEKGRPAIQRLEKAVPIRSGPPAKVRRFAQRAGSVYHKLLKGLPIDR